MRVVLLGGTRFIGRAITEHLHASGDDVLVVHRGTTEPDDLVPVEHLHAERAELAAQRDAISAFRPEAVVDCLAMTRAGAEAALAAIPRGVRMLVLSSCDVYRAYAGVMAGTVTDPDVPLNEDAPVRENRYPYRGQGPRFDDYEKLDVEEAYLARGAIVARLPMVYGERDGQRREWFVLRRVRGGRPRIPFGVGTWRTSRGYVGDVARFVRSALERAPDGEIFNVSEDPAVTVREWAQTIISVAGSDAELVRVPDEVLPGDLDETGDIRQHLVTDAAKAREMLGWRESDPREALSRSVAWHLANPPPGEDPGFEADDRALERAL